MHAAPVRNGKKWGQHTLPPFETKRKETGAANVAPVRKEKKRHGGSARCPRSKRNKKKRGQQVLPPFEIKNEKRGKEEAMPPSLAVSPASSFPIPLPPRSIACPPRSSSIPPRRFRCLHPSRRGEAAVVTCRRLSSAVTWRVGVVDGGDVVCGGRLGR